MYEIDFIDGKISEGYLVENVQHLLMVEFDLSEEEAQAKINEYFMRERSMYKMDEMDLIWEKFSEGYSVETVLHLLMVEFDLSEEEAQAKIDEYFEIVEGMQR